MNRLIKNIFLLAVFSLFIYACSEMDEYKKFVKDGEIIYASRPDSIQIFPGNGRVKIKMLVFNPIYIKEAVVEWNEGTGSKKFPLSLNAPVDSIEVFIDDLEEKSYLFDLYTIDNQGSRSIKVQKTGTTYGEKYRQSLFNRAITRMTGGGTVDSISISWGQVVAGNVGVVIEYLNKDGMTITDTIPPTVSKTIIRNWEPMGIFKYKTLFVPEKNAIDTFSTNILEVQLPDLIEFKGEKLSKTGWTITDKSSEEPNEGVPNGLASSTIDDNLNTFWHTQWSGGKPGYPHYFVVDLQQTAVINKLECFRRKNDDRGQTSFQILTSTDGTSFTDQGTFEYDPKISSQMYILPNLPVARYVKYVALTGPDFFAFLAELDLYGQYVPDTKLDRSAWEITDFSSQEPAESQWGPPIQGLAAAVIDGDLGTFWHSAWDLTQPPYPHHFVVDMKETVKVGSIECFRRQGNNDGQTKFQILTSVDGVKFVDQGSFSFNSKTNAGQKYILKMLPEARYIKYVALEGPKYFAFLSEFYVYGAKL